MAKLRQGWEGPKEIHGHCLKVEGSREAFFGRSFVMSFCCQKTGKKMGTTHRKLGMPVCLSTYLPLHSEGAHGEGKGTHVNGVSCYVHKNENQEGGVVRRLGSAEHKAVPVF